MAETRPYWLFTAGVFAVGAVLAVFKSDWTAFFIFVTLCAVAVWVLARVTKLSEPEDDGPRRPSERRAARKASRKQ